MIFSIGNTPLSVNGNLLHGTNTATATRYVNFVQGSGGTFTAEPPSGLSGDIVTLTNTPSAHYTFSGYSVTGAELTGNKFMFGDTDVSAEAKFYPTVYRVTTQTDGHGKIAASTTGGTYGTRVALSNTANDGYRFSNYSITGSTLTGNAFNIGGNTTARANFSTNTASGKLYSAAGWSTESYVSDYKTYNLNAPTTGYNYITLFMRSIEVYKGYYAVYYPEWSITVSGGNGNTWQIKYATGAADSAIIPDSTQVYSSPICTGSLNPSRTADTWRGVYKHGSCWWARGAQTIEQDYKLIYDPQNKRCSGYIGHSIGSNPTQCYVGYKNIDFGNKITSATLAVKGSNLGNDLHTNGPAWVYGFNRFSDARKIWTNAYGIHEYSTFAWE